MTVYYRGPGARSCASSRLAVSPRWLSVAIVLTICSVITVVAPSGDAHTRTSVTAAADPKDAAPSGQTVASTGAAELRLRIPGVASTKDASQHISVTDVGRKQDARSRAFAVSARRSDELVLHAFAASTVITKQRPRGTALVHRRLAKAGLVGDQMSCLQRVRHGTNALEDEYGRFTSSGWRAGVGMHRDRDHLSGYLPLVRSLPSVT